MEQETKPLPERIVNGIRTSTTFRLFTIGFLILILLIPGSMIEQMIHERQNNHDSAINEISDKWGRDQTITGPIIAIPYITNVIDQQNKVHSVEEFAYYLPDDLEITGDMKSEKRHRGIYEAVLYESKLNIKGSFGPGFLNAAPDLPSTARLKDAKVIFGITDVRSIRNKVSMAWGDTTIKAAPGGDLDIVPSGIIFPLNTVDFTNGGTFSIDVELAGSQSLYFTPVGKNNIVKVNSDWATPSFDGEFLPINRTVTDKGFNAEWRVLELNRNILQHWQGSNDKLQASNFGVKMWIAADEYQKTNRSVKYCVLFISLTFIFFFIIELKSGKTVHPVQYLLIGLAISIFYLLLLSLSEWVGFDKSYFISAVAVTGLVGAFSISVLQSKLYSAIAVVVQVLLYVFLYTTLQLEDLSLLIGSIGLFITLSILMYFSRWLNCSETTA